MLSAALLVIFPCLVAFAGASDLFTMTIPNRVALLLLTGFALLAPFAGLSLTDIGLHLAAGGIVLALGFAYFAAGWMGGGDAKLAAAAAVWLGFSPLLLHFLLLAVIYGGALTLLLLLFRSVPVLPAAVHGQNWLLRLHCPQTGVPYGIAIALAALQLYPQTLWFAAVAAG